MAIYRVLHRTTYRYEDPVTICHNLGHLIPRSAPRHRWRNAAIEIKPRPAMHDERLDFFGNRLTLFAIQEPHTVLDVAASGIVEVEVLPPDGFAANSPWETVRDSTAAATSGDSLRDRQFLFESPYITWDSTVIDYANESFQPGRPIIDAARDLTKRIHTDFVYDQKATTVTTTVDQLMTNRRGVCQDLAHVQVACFRAMGLAARYVSGYLLTSAPAGRARLIGADASHAWVSVYVPGMGWVDFDPTNNIRPSDKHVTIAWGRDYGDVCPLRGVILGGGKQTVHVGVDVVPVA